MRILIVATQIKIPDTHGGSTHVAELARGLRRHGEVLALVRRNSVGENLLGFGLKAGTAPFVRRVAPRALYPAALAAARRFRPDVVYERGSSYGLGALLARALRVPLVCMVLDEHFSRFSLEQAGRIIAAHIDVVPPPFRQKAEQVGWGVNPDIFRPDLDKEEARRRLGIGPEEVVVGYAGSFKPWHALPVLIEAAARTKEIPAKFLLVGDGPGRKAVESLSRISGVPDRILMPGAAAYERVPGLLAAADLCAALINPGLHPGSRGGLFSLDPLKIFEYLALQKPVVASRGPGIEAQFVHGEHLYLVEPGDADGLAAAIRRFHADPAAWNVMAQNGYARVLSHHTWQAHADHLARIFEKLLEGAP